MKNEKIAQELLSKENLIITSLTYVVHIVIINCSSSLFFLTKINVFVFSSSFMIEDMKSETDKMSFMKYQWYDTRKIGSRYSKKKLTVFP